MCTAHFRPSHPSLRPIFCLSKSQTTSPLFTGNASLVPCPISCNPLPCSKNPCSAIVLLTCYTLPIIHVTLLSPFIYCQLFLNFKYLYFLLLLFLNSNCLSLIMFSLLYFHTLQNFHFPIFVFS